MRGVGPKNQGVVPRRRRIVLTVTAYKGISCEGLDAWVRDALLPCLRASGWDRTRTSSRETRRTRVIYFTLEPSLPTRPAASPAASLFFDGEGTEGGARVYTHPIHTGVYTHPIHTRRGEE